MHLFCKQDQVGSTPTAGFQSRYAPCPVRPGVPTGQGQPTAVRSGAGPAAVTRASGPCGRTVNADRFRSAAHRETAPDVWQ